MGREDEGTIDKMVAELNTEFKIIVLEVIEGLIAAQGVDIENSTYGME